MNFFEFCGMVGAGVSALVVLAVIALVVLAAGCVVLGAYESATNPNAASQTQQEYSALQQNISAGSAQLDHVVPGAGL